MRICVIGAGNLATHLAKALVDAGHEISKIYSRTEASATKLAAVLGCDYTTDINSIGHDANVYVVSVSDNAITSIIDKIFKGREDKILVHTSGSVSIDVFRGKAKHYGVVYPLQTFSKDKPLRFKDISLFVEASDAETESTLLYLCKSIAERVELLDSTRRKYLHLAAVFACNFVNHCYCISSEILKKNNIPFSLMLPLIGETAEKIRSLSPAEAQTGPAVRHDTDILEKHMALLDGKDDWKILYDIMSKSIHETRIRHDKL